MRIEPYSLAFVPDCFKTQEMCDKVLEIDPFNLWYVPDNLKTQGMCIRAVEICRGLLQFVPDWFVTHQQVEVWCGQSEYDDDDYDTFSEWYNGYKKRKAQKAKTKEEFFPIAWHPDRVMVWCMSEDKKRQWK